MCFWHKVETGGSHWDQPAERTTRASHEVIPARRRVTPSNPTSAPVEQDSDGATRENDCLQHVHCVFVSHVTLRVNAPIHNTTY